MSQVFEADDANFESEVLGNEIPVLVDFSATWCAPCRKLEPIVEDIAGEYAGRLKVVRVDVDNARNIAARFGVMSVPTVMLFKGGQVKDQVIGVLPRKQLADRVDQVL